jgi:hypothetical protein
MRVAIPHNLDKATVRQRLRTNGHKIADQFPGGMAQVETHWPNDDTMAMTVRAMGQELRGDVEIEEGQVVFNVILPPALSFVEPIVQGAIRQSGEKLLAPPER